MTTHTPGPWHIGVKQAEKIVYNAKGWAIANATVYHGESDRDEVSANARLIAAAPDLLAALERMLDAFPLSADLRRVPDAQCEAIDLAETAIAKAEGRS